MASVAVEEGTCSSFNHRCLGMNDMAVRAQGEDPPPAVMGEVA